MPPTPVPFRLPAPWNLAAGPPVALTADPLSGVAVWCPRSLVAERSVSIQSPSHSSLTLGQRGYRPRVKNNSPPCIVVYAAFLLLDYFLGPWV